MAEPGGPALAALVRQGDTQTEADRIADGIFGVRDISNLYLVSTDGGDVLINTGFMDNAERNRALIAPHRRGTLAKIILTQSHADHFGGIEAFKEPGTEVIAGPGFAENWQDMKRLMPFFGPRSHKLWGATLNRGSKPVPPPEVAPDREIGDRHAFELDGEHFELLHTPEGETTDSLTVWLPRRRIAFTGNLFGPVWCAMPFLNTIRGDRPRSVRSYLKSLARVRDLEAETIVTGHGDPITGAARICADLNRMEAAVRYVRDATLDGMNAGRTLGELMDTIALPPEIAIKELHGNVRWAIKAIWHEYAGWFRYESTTELYGTPPSSVHPDLAELAGGADALTRRAAAHVAAGRPLEALHILDIALGAEPACIAALSAKADALAILLERSGQTNLSETMWLRAEIARCKAQLDLPERNK